MCSKARMVSRKSFVTFVVFGACCLHTALAFNSVSLHHYRKPTSALAAQAHSKALGLRTRRRATELCRMKIGGSGSDDTVPPLERFVACLPYALPLSDAFEWGHFLFDKFPLLTIPFVPLFPVISLLNAPFVSFAVFIVLFSFVTRNPSFSRFIRFNTLQAIYLDIVLIFPQILKSFNVIGAPVPIELAEVGSNTVFYAITLAVVYCSVTNIGGKFPNEIPLISESVDSQMPF